VPCWRRTRHPEDAAAPAVLDSSVLISTPIRIPDKHSKATRYKTVGVAATKRTNLLPLDGRRGAAAGCLNLTKATQKSSSQHCARGGQSNCGRAGAASGRRQQPAGPLGEREQRASGKQARRSTSQTPDFGPEQPAVPRQGSCLASHLGPNQAKMPTCADELQQRRSNGSLAFLRFKGMRVIAK
jgi:hypothetical protein